MSLQYKNQSFNLTTSNLTTVLTIDSQSRALVKGMNITNQLGSTVLVKCQVKDNSASSNTEFFHKTVANASTETDVAGKVLVLEESDSIKVQSATADAIQGVISYALINRSDQNG
tara:strand:+ start:232 stop:576 length:345 start_codon:yes stop_codon:yes gene_type:complete